MTDPGSTPQPSAPMKKPAISVPPAPAFVLVRPQLGENIGAAARAMVNFGLEDLRIVAPRDGWPNKRAIAAASRAFDFITPRLFATLEEAIADLTLVYATTGRRRELVKEVLSPRPAITRLEDAARSGNATGILFGPERAGLETAEIATCQALLTLPVNPQFPSLNLGQIVVILAYEWVQAREKFSPADVAFPQILASQAELAGLYDHLESELHDSGFFHPPEKTPAMIRNIRASLARPGFTEQEIRTWRGIIKALAHRRGRHNCDHS